MGNMISLRTFRADGEVITADPSERSDYDETTWVFDVKTGLEISKTYADNSSVVKTYDSYNRLATETDARGNVKTHSYEQARGLHLGTTYTVVDGTAVTTARSFSYNHLGKMTQVVDDSGTRNFGYNSYGERETDSLMVDGDTHLITEQRDSFGRSVGYIYSKNGSAQQTVSTGYGDDGRIDSAGFLHGGEARNFGYTYLAGTNMLQVLTKPNGMTLTQTYDATRNLLTGMAYHRGSTLVAQRAYTYDILGRPTARDTARQGKAVSDTFAHNSRSELVDAQVNGKDYEYAYDNIGNREFAMEEGKASMYEANALNQYASISENGAAAFVPQFDTDGNQTLIKTDTGIWSTVYNAENRPVSFTNSESNTVVECQYDSMGRRAYKKVTVNGEVTLHQRYIYRGYLQIATLDLTRSHHPALWFITWDPIQPVATRPLVIQINGTWFTYGWNLTKNICELYSTNGSISTSYTYTPFGKVTATGSLTQPIQWSSEVWDGELGLVYYNWRYYNAMTGRWNSRDMINFENKYAFVDNQIGNIDILGLIENREYMVEKAKRYYRNKDKSSTYFSLPDNGIAYVLRQGVTDAYCRFIKAGKFVSSPEEFVEKANMGKSIKSLIFVAHGSSGPNNYVEMNFSDGSILMETAETEMISDLFSKINFSKSCSLELRVCHLGESPYLKERLKNKTGCSVTLYTGKVNAIFPF
ncbi:MAG: RHS repeat-associated core domain-containing protein [Bacteroidaceae bacterium]|nr:RHS repeat-associated core domain-containing protein [Bacteroidaceae bacterium]